MNGARVLAAFLCAVVVAPAPGWQDRATASLSAMDVLELYELGDPASVKLLRTSRPIASIADEITMKGGAWVVANGPSEAKRRRVVIATFALEAARHAFNEPYDWASARMLFEWASTELRRDGVPHPAERLWRQALLAFLSRPLAMVQIKSGTSLPKPGSETPLTLFEAHLGLAERRFPGDPRWLMARAWVAERFALGDLVFYPPLDTSAAVPPEPIRLYERAAAIPAIAMEAQLHLGFIRLVEGRVETAMTHLNAALGSSGDPGLRSLAHLFSGWAISRLGNQPETVAAYQRAHDAEPEGQTAALFLSTELFLSGRRAEAMAVTDRTLRSNSGEDDPWRLFYQGEYGRLARLMNQLHEALQ